ncbi:hypothetical protein [Candidatus Williamhamiltonella defendens]|nr:hypothetical protein [Candidatus Hamiltonella defensa]
MPISEELIDQLLNLLKLFTGDISGVYFSHAQIIKLQRVLVKTLNRF